MFREASELLRELGKRAALYQAGTLLSIVYWSVVAATALTVRISRRTLLPDSFGSGRSHWLERAPVVARMEDLTRQF